MMCVYCLEQQIEEINPRGNFSLCRIFHVLNMTIETSKHQTSTPKQHTTHHKQTICLPQNISQPQHIKSNGFFTTYLSYLFISATFSNFFHDEKTTQEKPPTTVRSFDLPCRCSFLEVCSVSWSGPHQGQQAHVDRYRRR